VDAQFRRADAEKVADKVVASAEAESDLRHARALPTTTRHRGAAKAVSRRAGVHDKAPQGVQGDCRGEDQAVGLDLQRTDPHRSASAAAASQPEAEGGRQLVSGRDSGRCEDRTNSYVWVPSARPRWRATIVFQRTMSGWRIHPQDTERRGSSLCASSISAPQSGGRRTQESRTAGQPGAIKSRATTSGLREGEGVLHSAEELIATVKQKYADLELEPS